jgi:2-polyprenyl-6-methoxyphenol hydroxylase-like FAD-dependent oxidoreductase
VTARDAGTEIVVVGGGIAGSAAAARLAAAGRSVILLERDEIAVDRVRGEGLVNWGFEAAQTMGLGADVLDTPDASVISTLVTYDEMSTVDQARRQAQDLSRVLPGTPGIIGVGHPELRTSLAAAAEARGATVLRGARVVDVVPGTRPAVTYEAGGESHTVHGAVVLVADGKDSPVRRSLDIELHVTRPRVTLTGMLVDDGGAWDRAETSIGVVNGDNLYVIPRGGGMVRLYVGRLTDDSRSFTGPDRHEQFLTSFRVESLPHADAIAGARVAGPCASFPMTDSWTSIPATDGVVLLGDAAGWSNPVIGQGLAVALRDAQVVTDLFLEHGRWCDDAMRAYADERGERMRRLRFASALTELVSAHGAADRPVVRRRILGRLVAAPELGLAFGALHGGPWRVPEAAFAASNLTDLALG